MQYSIHDARTRLSKILAEVAKGNDVIITSGSSRKPIMKISRVEEPQKGPFGFAKDLPPNSLPPKFCAPLPEEDLKVCNGEGD